MRHCVAILFCCALMSAVFVALPAQEAQAYDTGQAAVDEAYSWIGTPYGAYGADCSGFTSIVYGDQGVYLPDDPAAQYSYGVPSDASAGDLVFFNESGYGISHVGIATGYGTVVHASTYFGIVTETPISDIPGYVGAVDPS
ncbi:MAG: C40 family peptidase [Rubrobacteraceae bacterium]